MAKVGRKRKPHTTAWGETIDGLGKTKDRWRCLTCRKFLPAESDERRAVANFRRHVEQEHSRSDLRAVETTPVASYDGEGGQWSIAAETSSQSLWGYVGEQIRTRPEWVAQQTGIPELARLADLPKPQPSPTLEAVGKLYLSKAEVTPQEHRESAGRWQEFQAFMIKRGVTTLRKLTANTVADYGDDIRSRGKSPTYVKHRFGKVKTVINFARKRGLHPDDCRHALDCCAVLTPPKGKATNPAPISRDDLHKLLSKADDRTKAAILLSMNLCLAPKEIVAVEWDELDLTAKTFVSSRNKTGVTRVGILWDETIQALQKFPRKPHMPVFISARGTERLELRDDWQELRDAAGVKVELASLKDGAYTAAVEAETPLDTVKVLAGHATGISDHYLRRRPNMVEDACAAIYKHYFG